jgi:hypothetical protein
MELGSPHAEVKDDMVPEGIEKSKGGLEICIDGYSPGLFEGWTEDGDGAGEKGWPVLYAGVRMYGRSSMS